jgi:light-regulated signal transduction histidine kinase (bacteriophytochrome)
MKLIEMIKEHDDKMEELLTSHENLLCAFGRLVDDIIDKDLGLCVDYKLVENSVAILKQEKWMDSTRSHVWAQVMQGLCDTSVKKVTMMKLVEQEEEKLEEDYRVAQLKGEV